MEEKVLKTPRGGVHYFVERNADPNAKCIVFLHGLTADHTLFDKQTEYFSREYTVLTWDAPAHGASRPYNDFGYYNAADDLKAILDTERIERPVLAGQSMGGYVIQAFLCKYPDAARGFVSIDSCPFGEKYYSASDRWWLRQIEWMSRCYPYNMLVKAVAKGCTTTEFAYENMLSALRRYEKKELCWLMGAGFSEFLKANRDMKIECPVLLICGEKDRTGKVISYDRAWSKSEGYELHMIPNAAHNSNADAPETVNALIDEFVRNI